MKKLAFALFCVSVLACVFSQSIETVIGLSGYFVAAAMTTVGLALVLRAVIVGKSYAFDRHTTEGGFLS